ncbi:hypothetical protein BC826DRAFT_1108774 [Russula brevipes]|nr:hypothetical protein BC826DRAFT_1108774 [Russula brevipes]
MTQNPSFPRSQYRAYVPGSCKSLGRATSSPAPNPLSNQFRSVVRTPGARTALLAHRNTLAPISVLPPEVLALAKPAVRTAELQVFTHVCRHSRQVALDDSSLWARISGNQTSTAYRTDLRDTRARNAPLAIDLLWTPNEETLACSCSLRTSRIHASSLRSLVTRHFDENVRKVCNLEAPALLCELGVAVASPITFLETTP